MKTLTLFLTFLSYAIANVPGPPPTAAFPGSQATWQSLTQAANQAFTTVSSPVAATDTVINVVSGTVFPTQTVVTIDQEIIQICAVTATTVTTCTGGGRGWEGTTPSAHNAGAYVQQRLTAGMHNQSAAEIIAIENQMRAQYPSLFDFGGLCNNLSGGALSDDHIAIQGLTAFLTNQGGGRGQLPVGRCGTSVPLRFPSGVVIEGQDSDTSGITALPTFPANGIVTCFGNIDCGTEDAPVYGVQFSHLTIDCGNVPGAIGFQTAGGEEMTTIEYVNIYACHVGMNLTNSNYGNQNMRYYHVTVGGTPADPNGVGILAYNINARGRFEDMTVSGQGGCSLNQPGTTCANTPGILCINCSDMVISGIHCETYHTCVMMQGGSNNLIESIGITTFNVVAAVYLCGGAAGGGPANDPCLPGYATGATIHDIYGTYASLVDDVWGTTVCTGGLCIAGTNSANVAANASLYQHAGIGTYDSTTSGIRVSTVPGGMNLSSAGISTTLAMGNGSQIQWQHEAMGDMGNSGFYAIAHSNNPQGLFIQSTLVPGVGTTAGGGLALMGNGYAADPAYGSMLAGCVTDGGTVYPLAPGCAGVQLIDGGVTIFGGGGFTANSGTPINVAAIQMLVMTPAGGVRFPSLHAASGTRALCVDPLGNVTASATACSGS